MTRTSGRSRSVIGRIEIIGGIIFTKGNLTQGGFRPPDQAGSQKIFRSRARADFTGEKWYDNGNPYPVFGNRLVRKRNRVREEASMAKMQARNSLVNV